VVLPAQSPDTAAGPVFFLAGGPGQGATSLAPLAELLMPGLRARHEIVLLDQRGTGESNGLNCPLTEINVVLRAEAFDMDSETLDACRRSFDADLTLYTTPIAMDDLDEVRAALGYERINIWGGSYGTRAALVYMRRHPERVRAVVLRGVAPTTLHHPLYFAEDAQKAWQSLVETCEEDNACNTAHPDLNEDLEKLIAALEQSPVRVSTLNPVSQDTVEVEMTADVFTGGVRLLLYSTQFAGAIPSAIESGLAGDFGPFLQPTVPLSMQILQTISIGMFMSVVCAEDIPYIDAGEAERLAEGTWLGDRPVRHMKKACEGWPLGTLPPGYHDPVRSDAPVLLISGADDPVTPPRWAEHAARTLPNSLHVVLPGTGHIPPVPGCTGDLVARFLKAGLAEGLDASCVQDLRRPPISTSQ
jgi:pimeloyl-ACP methyl ester carboxylesterase